MALTKVTGDFIKAGSITQGHLHSSHGITTTHITEGDKLFFTNARVDSRVGSLSTSNLSEGTNLYYTDARVDARIAAASTSDLSEGTNLYYTDARADARVALIVDSAPGTLNTLNELAAALGDDANFSTTVTNSIATKLPLAGGTLTGALSGTSASFSGNVTASSGTGHFSVVNSSGYQLNGTYVMDSSRNLVNIAAITASGNVTGANLNISNWDTAYGWGNHASAGYLTSFDITTQTDGKYLRSNTADEATHRIVFSGCDTNNHDTIATSTGSLGAIEIYNNGVSKDAFMTFHVGSDFACYFGLDGGTNKLSVGGWSMGAASYEIYHAGNLPSLATLGYTGATNANYITNNNQLTNGAGYITSYTETDTLATVTGRGASTSSVVTLTGGSKIVVQGSTDGGASRGIFMWNNTDSNWGIYMSTPGSTNNIGGGTAPSGLNGETSHSIRFRIASNASNGFIWENHNNAALMSLRGSAGDLITSSSMRSPIFYDSNNTTYFLNPSASGGNALNTIGDWRQTTDAWSGEVSGKMQYHSNHWYLQAAGYVHFRNTSGVNTFYVDSGGVGYVNNYLTGANSLRAPIFYDSGNTGYYVDPNSTSRLLNLDFGVAGYYLKAGDWGTRQQTPYGWIQFGPANTSHAHIYTDRSNFYFNKQIYVLGGSLINQNDIRAAIFYDINDTNYYVNPGVTSSNSTSHSARFRQSVWIGDSGTYNQNDGGWGARLIVSDDVHARIDVAQDADSMRSSWWSHTGNGGSVFGTITGHHQFLYSHNAKRQTLFNGYSQEEASYRAPIFYDSNDTAYYVNPASESKIVKLWINNGGAGGVGWSTGFNQGSGSNYWNQIQDASVARQRNFGGGGYDWYSSGGTEIMDLNNSGVLFAAADMRSPIFYDSNNTAYYLNPQDQSSMYGVAVRGDNANTGTGNQIFFWGSGNSTTSAIGFKANGGNFTNPTGSGDGYNTYLTMDTAGRGWVFRQGTGSSNFTSLYNSGWILNNGIWQANASMRSPVFYDSNDTGYYMNYLGGGTLRGNFQFAANSTSTSYNDASIELRESNYTANGTATPPFIGFHWGGVVASSIAIESNGRIAIRNNPGNAYEKFIASVIYASSDVQSPIYYDSNDTAYYTDPASTSSLKLLKTGQNHQSNAPRWDTSFYVAQSQHFYAHSSTQTMYLGESNTINIRSVGIASGSLRAPLFYDSNNTAYYADPGSTSNMNAVTLVGTFSGQNGYFNQDLAVGFNSGAIGGKVNIQINSNNGIGVKNNLNGRSGVTGLLQYTSASYASSGYNMVFQAVPPSGSDQNMLLCYINGNIVNRFNSYGQYSDIKLKENIVDTTPKLEDVKRIRIRNFNFKGDPYKQIGVVAQEFEEVFPGLVEDKEVPDEEGTTKTVKYSVLVPILVKAMQEQQTIIDDLKSRLETLENQ